MKKNELNKREDLKPLFFDGVVGASWKIPMIIIFAIIAWLICGAAFYLFLELVVAFGDVVEFFR